MHIADPTHRHLRRQRDRRRRPADRGRAPRPRRSSAHDGSVAVAFFGDGAVAHGTFHEAVNLAAVWQLPVIFFCENNGYAEFSPAVDPARGAARAARRRLRRRLRRGRRQRRRGDRGRDGRRWSTRLAPGAVPSSSRPPPTAGTATTKATRSATARPTRCGSGRRATRCSSTRAGSESAGVADDDARVACESSVARELDDAVEAARRLAPPGGRHADRLRRPARDPTRAEPPPPAADAPVFRTMDAIRDRARSRARRATSACSSPASTSAPAATCSA